MHFVNVLSKTLIFDASPYNKPLCATSEIEIISSTCDDCSIRLCSLALGHCIVTLAAQLRQLLPHLDDINGQDNPAGSLNPPTQISLQAPEQSASLPANGTQGSLGALSCEAGTIGTLQGRPIGACPSAPAAVRHLFLRHLT